MDAEIRKRLMAQAVDESMAVDHVEIDGAEWETLAEYERDTKSSMTVGGDKLIKIVYQDYSDDDLHTLHAIKQTKLLASINSSLSFFKVLAVIGLICAGIVIVTSFM